MSIDKHYQPFLNNTPYLRSLKNYEPSETKFSSAYILHENRSLINFSSNDYLGLAKHPLLIQRSQEYTQRWGAGGTASRLVVGNLPMYNLLERKLAHALKKPAALILGAGYQTNTTVLAALFDSSILKQQPVVFCDKYCHNSLLAPCTALPRFYRFHHNNLDHLQVLLAKHGRTNQAKFIIVESLYSMDGDVADLATLTKLAKQYQACLYIDDAHAVGVYGKTGFAAAATADDDHTIMMGTFSKALGGYGAYIGCSTVVRHYLINKCRGLIYSTSLPPGVLGAIDAALELVPTMAAERQLLAEHSLVMRNFFKSEQLNCGNTTTHIIPWIIGDENITLQASELLVAQGILGVTIRSPTVPRGQARIRFCLTAVHSKHDIELLQTAIRSVKAQLKLG